MMPFRGQMCALASLTWVLIGCVPATYTRVPPLTGRVVDLAGRPVPNAMIEIVKKPGMAGPDVSVSVPAGGDGQFALEEDRTWFIYIVPTDLFTPKLVATAHAGAAKSLPLEFTVAANMRPFGIGRTLAVHLGDFRVPLYASGP